ncbi:hypothetical protein [Flammeovirga aprica]|uniref:DUF1444 family protein n=1 Tax=Flammeovirga aprica JL-4 TaxID=694437 RepID=A0A7X9RW75_9BACT|nr:hypothetical protein [Flammeovirga aprica]NME69847.1 hypothetical protein [Flammeovirga aprica JL-4]
MDKEQFLKLVQQVVLKELSSTPNDDKNLFDIFSKYGISMPIELYPSFINHQLIAPGYAEMSFTTVDHFKVTSLGVSFAESIAVKTVDLDEENKVLMPSIKTHDDMSVPMSMHESLLNGGEAMEKIPYITYGYDTPEAFVAIQKGDDTLSLEELRERSIKNLSNIEVDIKQFDLSGIPMIVCAGNYYASEKILDHQFMLQMQEKLNAELLAVSMPRKGFMFIIDGAPTPEVFKKFIMITSMKYIEDENTKPLSTKVFVVQDGELSGLIQLGEKEMG